jgi:enoyl-CoA hydratase/carnithine racemase
MRESPTPELRCEDGGGVRRLAFNRPHKLNALDARLFIATSDALQEVRADASVKCVVLTGMGRAFSAGSDLADETPNPGAAARFVEMLAAFPKPVIASVNGLAIGIGVTLLGLCDLVLSAESARFRLPFVPLGLCPEAGSGVTLAKTMGPQAAAYAFYTGAWIAAPEAARLGLVWRTVADDELVEATETLAGDIAAMPVDALQTTKHLLLEQRLPALRSAIRREAIEFDRLRKGDEHRRAVEAFFDRRAATS